ncbi:MAG TPA: 7-cyano-7-deazaguanine synthase, partial [Longimicrobium sp.]|nr:7-cyano-7-deazaguanine synthase [Longimicrobium sp.]
MLDTVILLSGGLDSTVLLAYAIAERREPLCVSFAYGATHGEAELASARAVAAHYGVPHQTSDISGVFASVAGASTLTGGDGPAYLPNRNAVFLSVAVAVAEVSGAGEVWFGAHGGDRRDFPDCRPEFVKAFDRVAQIGTTVGVRVRAPWVNDGKSAIVQRGIELNAPLHLTHSCYRGTSPACGLCSACGARMRAF